MPANQLHTDHSVRFALAFLTLCGGTATVRALEPDQRGILGLNERPAALVKADPGMAKPGKPKRIRVLARSMPWQQTLDWLGKETGMGVITSVTPDGSFNVYGPSREYTIPELVDLLNNQLKVNKNPCLLVRTNTDFQLIPYELNKPNIDLTNLPRVTVKELDQHGETELVILELSFEALEAKEVATELFPPQANRSMLGPLGRVIAIPNANQLILRDTVQNLKNIAAILQEADETEKKKGEIYKHKCIYVKAEVAENVLKDVLGIAAHNQPAPGQPGQPNQPIPPQPAQAAGAQKHAVHVTADKVSNTVFVSGPIAKIQIAKKTVEELEEANKGQPAIVTGPPTMKIYKILGGNAPDVAKALKELFGSRSATVSPVGKDSILVLAVPEDQEAVRKYIEGSKDQTDFKAIQLYQLDAKTVFDNLTTLFDVKNATAAPALDFDKSRNMILVRGTTEQVEQVKQVLKQLGEQELSGKGSGDQIVINVEKGSASALAEALTVMIPQRRKNPVHWVRIRKAGLGDAGESKDTGNGDGTQNGNRLALVRNDPPAKADNRLPGDPNAPIFLSAVGTKLTATCSEPDALRLVSEIYQLLKTPAGEGDYETIKLLYARAADAAKTLDMAFNGTKPENNNRSRFFWYDDYRQEKKEKEPRIRVVPDSAANSLLVQANPLDMILIHKLLKDTIDVNNTDSNAIIQNHLIPLKYADVLDVEWAIKDVYREHLNNNLSTIQSGALRNSFIYGGMSLNTDANGNPRPVDLTVTSVLGTNTLIVGCPKLIYEDIYKLAMQLDEAAKDSRKVWMAVPIKGMDPALIQQALDAIQGKHRNNTGTGTQPGRTPGGGGSKGSGSNSQSRGPDFFGDGVKDDPKLARSDDAHGGPDFFVHGVKDDPQSSSVFYDPQRDSGVKTAPPASTKSEPKPEPEEHQNSIPNFHLVKLEEQQPPPPAAPGGPQVPPGPRGPVTAEALPELGVIVLSATSQADLEKALALIRFIQQLGAVAEIQIQITELKYADATSVANTLGLLYRTVSVTPAGNVRAPTTPVPAPGAAPRPGQPVATPQPGTPTPGTPTPTPPGGTPTPGVTAPTAGQQFASVVLIPLPRINGLMWAAPRARVEDVANEIRRLDVPNTPAGETHPFPLRKASATRVEDLLRRFYALRYPNEPEALHQIRFTSEATTNTLFVQAAPSDLTEIREMIDRIDNTVSIAVNDLRIIPLRYAVATDLATLMTQAITAGTVTPGTTTPGGTTSPGGPGAIPPGGPGAIPLGGPGAVPQPGSTGAIPPGGTVPPAGTTQPGARPGATGKGISLKFYPSPRPESKGPVATGILEDIFITPDTRTNSLIISAPEKTMELLIALIHDLDTLPTYRADIKVFQLRRADAPTMAAMLNSLFYGTPGTTNVPPRPVQPIPSGLPGGAAGRTPITPGFTQPGATPTPGAQGALPPPLLTLGGVTPEGAPLVPIRITVDERTNSLIVVGTPNDLDVILTILSRLEDTEVVTRKNEVYHLRNSSANDLAAALSTFLTTSLSVYAQTGELNAFQEIERDVIIIPEPITNKLLISATPNRFPEVMRLIEELDSQPPQVVIQVLIAEVDLTNNEEFGVEIGLQNPVLFRRSVGIATSNTTIPTGAAGFNFNNPSLPLPNTFAADPGIVGFQSLGNFGTGRVSPTQGVGGFVFSAASDTFNLLIRALKVQGRLDLLSRPQLMTVDGQQATLNIGTLQPISQGSFVASTGSLSNSITYINIGINLTVIPRVNPDNSVLMRVVPEVSSVGATVTLAGQTYTSFNNQHIETTVLAGDGETVAIGGLITKSDQKNENKIPWVGDLPYVGALFRYRTQYRMKRELLVIMTPHVVRSRFDADRVLAEESRRMDWVLSDIAKVQGTSGLAPIFPPPQPPRGAGLPGVVPNPSAWPGISCPPSPLPGAPLEAPTTQESLPPPRTEPGSQSQGPQGANAQAAWVTPATKTAPPPASPAVPPNR